jgi:hypothetical protein
MKYPGILKSRSVARAASSTQAPAVSSSPAIDPIEFAELREPCGHRERNARKRAGLVNRALG